MKSLRPKSTTRESRLVLLAQTGDRAALDELLRSLQRDLYLYLLRLTSDPHLAEDVLQEVFITFYRKLRWLREPAALRAWVLRIASRTAFKHLRRRRSLTEVEQAEDLACEEPELPELGHEWREKIPRWIAQLSPASRAVIVLHYLNGLSLEQVGGILELPLGTVKSRLGYGLRRLRELAEPETGAHARLGETS